MAGKTPTQLTLRQLRADGWPLIEVVERWNPHARRRQDLFGIIDVLAVGPAGVLAVQATSRGHVSHRKVKMAETEALAVLLDAGWQVEVWGWDKDGRGRWRLGRRVSMICPPCYYTFYGRPRPASNPRCAGCASRTPLTQLQANLCNRCREVGDIVAAPSLFEV